MVPIKIPLAKLGFPFFFSRIVSMIKTAIKIKNTFAYRFGAMIAKRYQSNGACTIPITMPKIISPALPGFLIGGTGGGAIGGVFGGGTGV